MTEADIERYLRRPETLDEETRAAIADRIANSADWRAIAEEIEAFYTEFDRSAQVGSPRLEAFLGQLQAPQFVFALHPVRFESGPRSPRPTMTTIMAADSTDARPPPPRLHSVSLTTSDHRAMVRLLHDRQTQSCRLFVLTEGAEQQGYVLFSVSELGLEIATDASGEAAFDAPTGFEPEQWEQIAAQLRFPLASFQLQRDVRDTMLADYLVTLEAQEQGVQIQIKPRSASVPEVRLVLLDHGTGKPVLVPMVAGQGLLTGDGCFTTVHLFA